MYFCFHFSFETEKRKTSTVFHFLFFCKNEKRMKKFEIQSNISIEHQEIGNLLNFHFHFCIKNENKYSILNFVFQFIMKMKWHFGYTDYHGLDQKSITEIKKKEIFSVNGYDMPYKR